jgi:isoamylase
LHDLYACNTKNNGQAWPYGPSDGGDDNNNSWDQGGAAADQRQAARNGLALMMLSAGVPMINGGDESLRSLQCNNNPYNLDSSANWLNWNWNTDQSNFQAFARG